MNTSGSIAQNQGSEEELQGLINDMEQTAELGDSSNSSEVLLSLSASDRDTTVLADSGINGDESIDEAGVLRECRICQEEDPISDLVAPCACSGTVKWVHHDCVQKWVTEKGNIKCEICGTDFKGSYTIPDRREQDERLQRLEALAALGQRLFLRETAMTEAELEEQDRAIYHQATATGQRVSMTYCFSLLLLILGMVLMHHTFNLIQQETQGGANNVSYTYNETVPDTDAYMYPSSSGNSNGPHINDAQMDWGIVTLWLFLRIFVVILPLVVMMRVVAVMREAREANESHREGEQSVAIELQHMDIESLFQRMEARGYTVSVGGSTLYQRGTFPSPSRTSSSDAHDSLEQDDPQTSRPSTWEARVAGQTSVAPPAV